MVSCVRKDECVKSVVYEKGCLNNLCYQLCVAWLVGILMSCGWWACVALSSVVCVAWWLGIVSPLCHSIINYLLLGRWEWSVIYVTIIRCVCVAWWLGIVSYMCHTIICCVCQMVGGSHQSYVSLYHQLCVLHGGWVWSVIYVTPLSVVSAT